VSDIEVEATPPTLLQAPTVEPEESIEPGATPAPLTRRARRPGYDYHAFWKRNSGYILITVITLLAAFLRTWHLGALPPGLHGDEAWTGIEAHRILDEGYVGPFVSSALGQPAGALYWAALVLKLVGDGVFQVRLAMALLGIATIPLTYLAARVMFDSRRMALLSALVLTVMQWHLIFSRTAFIAVSWPLLEMITVLCLFLALKLRNQWWFASAGLALGLGVYTANVYPVFMVGVIFFVVLQMLQARPSRRGVMATGIAIMAVCTLITVLPMVRYASNHGDTFKSEHDRLALTRKLEWAGESFSGRMKLVAEATWDYAKLIAWGNQPNLVDGSGRKPTVDWLTLMLVAGGVVYCLKHWWKPETQLLLIMLTVIPIGAVLWLEGLARTTVGLAPFLAMLAGLSIDKLWTLADETAPSRRQKLYRGAVPAVIVALAVFNLGAYFQDFGTHDNFSRFVYAKPIAAASEFVKTQPNKPYVYFFSGRWSYFYETRRYLAPDVLGEDRSTQFGRFDLSVDRAKNSVIVLMPPYLDIAPQLRNFYPDAQVTTRMSGSVVLFTAFYIPAIGPR
jgi:4-amino-4-deoxy-L-arabinose transferase-like glycosyltransferase